MYRVRFGLEKQRSASPHVWNVGAAFGVVGERSVLLAPRLSPPKSRHFAAVGFDTRLRTQPLCYALPGRAGEAAAERGTSGTLVTEILGAPQRETVKEKQVKSVLHPNARWKFVAGGEAEVSASPGPRPTPRLPQPAGVSC